MSHPVVTQLEQANDFLFDMDVNQLFASIRVFGDGLAAAIGGFAVIEQTVNHRVSADSATGAVFKFQVSGGNFPTLVVTTNEVERRHANVVEEHGVLHTRTGARLSARDQQVHGLYGDSGQGRINHEPTQVLMPFGLSVGHCEGPHEVATQGTPNKDLLAVDDVVVAVLDCRGLNVCQVGTRLWLREQLPGADCPREYGRQEELLLFVSSPNNNGRTAEPSA